EERPAHGDNLIPSPCFLRQNGGHQSSSHALIKKSSAPKLPDLSASAMGVWRPCDRVQGTPGSISCPMVRAGTPRALTTAPDVSPPATRKRLTPCLSSCAARDPRKSSIKAPDASRP